MASKKYLFLTGLCAMLATSTAFGQTTSGSANKDMTYHGGTYDYLDTAFIPQSRQDQERSFLNNQSVYPAKPADMWVLGINAGEFNYFSDVPAKLSWGAGISVRKSLGYTFSLRGGLNYGLAKGLDYKLGTPVANLPPSARSAYPAGGTYVANFKSTVYQGSLDLIASLNNIMFHQAQNKVDWYALVGYSVFSYQTKVDALNGNSAYDYSSVNFGGKRKDIRDQLKSLMDGDYETDAMTQARQQNFNNQDNGHRQWRHSLDFGMGAEFKLSKRVSLALEQKFTLPFDDYIDGKFLGSGGVLTSDKDVVSYTSVGFNFSVGNAAKRVAPLWWLNPLDYAYSELNAPRHMKIPTPILPDADGDGVTDQFDQDPNTPAGAAVDVHGKPLDTDGDGVPDYKDKQLITPTYCQPVDADGVGKCPCPDSTCYAGLIKANACNLGYLPSISFRGRSLNLSDEQQGMLDNVANQMRQSPDCKVVVTGHAEASKSSEQLAWDRVNTVINYLTEKEGISTDRFIFQYSGVPGDVKSVDLRAATDADNGPNTTPPPHPNLRRSK